MTDGDQPLDEILTRYQRSFVEKVYCDENDDHDLPSSNVKIDNIGVVNLACVGNCSLRAFSRQRPRLSTLQSLAEVFDAEA